MADLFEDSVRGAPLTLDDYISAPCELRDANPGSGAWLVQKWSAAYARHNAPAPKVAFKLSKPVLGGERRVVIPQFWQAGYDFAAHQGDPVIRV